MYWFCSRGVKGKDAAKDREGVDRSVAVQEDMTVQKPGSRGEDEIR